FKTENFKTGKNGQLQNLIEQQADQFGKKYEYRFDFKAVRGKIEALSKAAGYDFQYQITAKGL
ncbi:MAG: ribonucleoside-triphosphate reductase, partial [Chloroflexota bacterium]|nr:ribonucleoside-triphosphate reductase [Chloroflexota bacterium]